jgi:mono/diheme cytochrome c family protein
MKMRKRTLLLLIVLATVALILSACGGGAEAEPEPEEEMAEDAEHDDTEMEHDMEMDHGVPEDAAAVENPIEATEESIEAGATVFATNCATCHGESGAGDGPAAVGLDPKPADLSEDHVQGNTDGALFYIITNGREDTAMPAWEAIVSEEDRWNVVNFVRTFAE